MKPAMYIFINKGLGMSPGKIAAQAGHAAVEAALISCPWTEHHYGPGWHTSREDRLPLWDAWRQGLHYAKYVMEARDSEHLLLIEKYLLERRVSCKLIIDEGHTEVAPISATALGCAIVDKDDPHTAATFSSFKLYRDESAAVVLESTDRISRKDHRIVRKLCQSGRARLAQDFLTARPNMREAEVTAFSDCVARGYYGLADKFLHEPGYFNSDRRDNKSLAARTWEWLKQ